MSIITRFAYALGPLERFSQPLRDRLVHKLGQQTGLALFWEWFERHVSLEDTVPAGDPISIRAMESALISLMGHDRPLARTGMTAFVALMRDDIGLWEEFFDCRLTDGNEPCPHWPPAIPPSQPDSEPVTREQNPAQTSEQEGEAMPDIQKDICLSHASECHED